MGDSKVFNVFFLNLLYAVLGGCLTILFMFIAIRALDKITPFNTFKALEQDNLSVAVVFASMILGIGIAMGLVIGYSLN